MRHRILRVFGPGPAFQVCFASAATRADTHTSRRCGVSLSRYHGHRSTRSDPQSAAASILPTIPLAIAARSCIINIRRTNNPLPDKHCCYDPMTPPPIRTISYCLSPGGDRQS